MGTETDTDTETDTETGTGTEETGAETGAADGLKTALESERKLRNEAEKRAKAAERALRERELQGMSETERLVEEAKEQARQEATQGFRTTLVSLAARTAAAGKLQDPEDAVRLLDLSDVEVGSDGTVDLKALGAKVDALLKDKPYLAAAGGKPGPLPGGGANRGNPDTEDPNALIRRAAGRA